MANYVKFYRGTSKKYEAAIKQGIVNDDTLYFITDIGNNKGALYLGDTLISKDISNFSELADIKISDSLKNKDLLVYDAYEEAWVNQSILNAIGVFVGAKDGVMGANGLVPAPGENDENLFLRGDGIWAAPEVSGTISIDVDNKSISIESEDQTISLNNFGKKYYKYVAATETEAAHYAEQIVDGSNPWIAGLEARTIEENGEIVLGWFEPNPTTIEEINSQVSSLQLEVNDVKDLLGFPAEDNKPATGLFAKADADSVYTKEETEDLIKTEVAKYDHLNREVFNNIDEANEFIARSEKPENYIYMIAKEEKEGNKYDEYLFVNGSLELVGNWEVDLSGYVTNDKLETSIVIKTVEPTEFDLVDKHLTLKSIDISKVNGLAGHEAILNLNNALDALSKTVEGHSESIADNSGAITLLQTSVSNIQNSLNNYVISEQYKADLAVITKAITWHDI